MPDHDAPEFSFPIEVAALPPAGRSYVLAAKPDACARVAARLGLQKVDSLTARLDVKFAPAGIIKVTGQIDAVVVQSCVVTLAPVPATVTDAVDAGFITEERTAKEKLKRAKAKARGEEEEIVEIDAEDPPETAQGGRIDLGEVAVAHLALALDPYPRAPGAAFEPRIYGLEDGAQDPAPPISPFAALAEFKRRPKGS